VVNALSDSVSIVDIRDRPHVKQTLLVGDEPRDIVFAGPDQKAFISAAFRGQNHPTFTIDDMFTPGLGRGDVWVFDSDNPGADLGGTPITIVNLFTDAPRSLAVSPDGNTVYAAGFMSGNQTTTIDATSAGQIGKPEPSANIDGVTAPATGLIVKYDGNNWLDEAGTNWDSQVKFNLPDNDVFVIDASIATPVLIGSHSGVGTTLFNMTTAPDGRLFVSNTEARNEVRFEGEGVLATTVRGNTTKNRVTIIDGSSVTPYNLDHHINFDLPFGSHVSELDKLTSTAQPGSMVYHNDELWVLAFGSNKIQIFSDPVATGNGSWFDSPWAGFLSLRLPGGGPAGIVMQDYRDRAYVYSRYDHQLSVISSTNKFVINTIDLFSPEPASVKQGRPFLYDAELTSSNGTGSCGSCHIFGDLDGLAWDLGDPDASVIDNPNTFLPASLSIIGKPQFHPMKGPMTTQTLRGIADSGPMHWRGDRTGTNAVNGESMEAAAFKEFGGAFVGLVGRSEELSEAQLQSFTDFALQIIPPPNPVRNLDNSLTTTQTEGETIYFGEQTTGLGGCNDCHRLNVSENLFGTSKESTFEGFGVSQLFKIPHLRNVYQKIGMFGTSMNNPNESFGNGDQIKGFGYLGDGSIDTLINFFTPQTFNFQGPDPIARRRVSEYSLVFDSNLKPIVGQQVTLTANNASVAGPRIDLLIARGLAGDCDLIAWSSSSTTGTAVSARLLPTGNFKLSAGPQWTDAQIRSEVSSTGDPATYTCVPPGDGIRISRVP
jgi:DNA-binding beta-propeller fold protein YncE